MKSCASIPTSLMKLLLLISCVCLLALGRVQPGFNRLNPFEQNAVRPRTLQSAGSSSQPPGGQTSSSLPPPPSGSSSSLPPPQSGSSSSMPPPMNQSGSSSSLPPPQQSSSSSGVASPSQSNGASSSSSYPQAYSSSSSSLQITRTLSQLMQGSLFNWSNFWLTFIPMSTQWLPVQTTNASQFLLSTTAAKYSMFINYTNYYNLLLNETQNFPYSTCSPSMQYYNQTTSSCQSIQQPPTQLNLFLDCSQNCELCINQTFCLSCAMTSFPIFNLSQPMQACGTCPSNCNYCSPKNGSMGLQCLYCADGYYADSTGQCQLSSSCSPGTIYNSYFNSCMSCPTGCSSCSSLNTCLVCDSSYSYQANGSCISTSTNLSQCGTGEYYDNSEQACYTCSISCSQCSDFETCTQCESSQYTLSNGVCQDKCASLENSNSPYFYYDTNQSQCLVCPSNCSDCYYNEYISAPMCKSCASGYFQDTDNGLCYPISCSQQGVYSIPNSNGLCGYCSNGCQNCTDENNCLQCYSGQTMQSVTGNGGQQMNICSNCSLGYFYDTTAENCEGKYSKSFISLACQANCSLCSNSTSCSLCSSGSYLIMNNSLQMSQCVACPDQNCLQCQAVVPNPQSVSSGQNQVQSNSSSSQLNYTCTQCKSGFKLDSKLQVARCIKEECGPAFYFNQAFDLCLPCAPGCSNCSNYHQCNQCENNYMLNSNNGCDLACPNGQYLSNSTQACSNCSVSNCSQCQGPSQCSVCSHGFTLNSSVTNGSQCIRCPSGCQQCDLVWNPKTMMKQAVCNLCEYNFEFNSTQQCAPMYCSASGGVMSSSSQAMNQSTLAIQSSSLGMYYDPFFQMCLPCGQGCGQCRGQDVCDVCLVTDGSMTPVHGFCADTCLLRLYNRYLLNVTSTMNVSSISLAVAVTYDSLMKFQANLTSRNKSLPFWNSTNNSCSDCSLQNCSKCIYNQSLQQTVCANCSFGFDNINGTCNLTNCSQTKVFQAGPLCGYCPSNCANCSNATYCTLCSPAYNLSSQGMCTNKCFMSQFFNASSSQCQNCTDPNCIACKWNGCQTCRLGTTLVNATNGSNASCQVCPQNCSMCSQKNNTNVTCDVCQANWKMILGQCVPQNYCLDGQYFDKSSQSCQTCKFGCKACQDGLTCNMCYPGFMNSNSACAPTCVNGTFYNSSTMLCDNCTANCTSCLSRKDCFSCNPGFTLSMQTNQSNQSTNLSTPVNTIAPQAFSNLVCQSCSPNCTRCQSTQNSTQCYLCNYGFKLNLTTFQCQPQTCMNGSYFDPFTNECQSCPPQCSACSSPTTCQNCSSPQFHLTNMSTCVDKCAYKTKVINILMYYNLSSQNCSVCSQPNCSLCDNQGVCQSCVPGYSMQNGSSPQCLQCPANCTSCHMNQSSSLIICDQCQTGFFYNKSLSACSQVNCSLQNTFNLTTNTSSQFCDFCPSGCAQCTSKYQCLKCMNNSNIIQDKLTGMCISNCSQPNSFLNMSTGMCDNCSANCDVCTSKNTCTVCSANYFLNTDPQSNQSQQCAACPNNCESCVYSNSMGLNQSMNMSVGGPQCIACKEAYSLNRDNNSCQFSGCQKGSFYNLTTWKCQYCQNGCDICSNQTQCNVCSVGYQLSPGNGSCMQAPSQQGMGQKNYSMTGNSSSSGSTSLMMSCASNQYFDLDLNSCQNCSTGCNLCQDRYTCFSCGYEYSLVSSTELNQNISRCKPKVSCPQAQKFYDIRQERCIGKMILLVIKSYVDCLLGCDSCDSLEQCTQCSEGFFKVKVGQQASVCMSTCPIGYFADYSDFELSCNPCIGECSVCAKDKCFECESGYYLVDDASVKKPCVKTCPQGFMTLEDQKLCSYVGCNSSSPLAAGLNCSSALANVSTIPPTSCSDGYYLNTTTQPQQCEACDSSCTTCYGSTASQCFSCQSSYYSYLLSDNETNVCVHDCPSGFFNDYTTQSCQCKVYYPINNLPILECGSNCSECTQIGNKAYCFSCPSGFFLVNNTCYEACPFSAYPDSSGVCQACPNNCSSCNSTQCFTCETGSSLVELDVIASVKSVLFASQCIANTSSCPNGTYFDSNSSACAVCPYGCAQCSSSSNCTLSCNSSACDDCVNSPNQCVTCAGSQVLDTSNQMCVSNCSSIPGMFTNTSLSNGICDYCPMNCQSCRDQNTCDQCRAGYFQNTASIGKVMCLQECIYEGQYENAVTRSCETCQEGCLTCSGESTCSHCRAFTLNFQGECVCHFSYNVYPQLNQQKVVIDTYDIKWPPAFMDSPVPCSEFFVIRKNQMKLNALSQIQGQLISNITMLLNSTNITGNQNQSQIQNMTQQILNQTSQMNASSQPMMNTTTSPTMTTNYQALRSSDILSKLKNLNDYVMIAQVLENNQFTAEEQTVKQYLKTYIRGLEDIYSAIHEYGTPIEQVIVDDELDTSFYELLNEAAMLAQCTAHQRSSSYLEESTLGLHKLDVTRITILSIPQTVTSLFASGVLELHLNPNNFIRSNCVDYSLPYKIDFISLSSLLNSSQSVTSNSSSLLQQSESQCNPNIMTRITALLLANNNQSNQTNQTSMMNNMSQSNMSNQSNNSSNASQGLNNMSLVNTSVSSMLSNYDCMSEPNIILNLYQTTLFKCQSQQVDLFIKVAEGFDSGFTMIRWHLNIIGLQSKSESSISLEQFYQLERHLFTLQYNIQEQTSFNLNKLTEFLNSSIDSATIEVQLYAMNAKSQLIARRAEITLVNLPKLELTYDEKIKIAAFSPYQFMPTLQVQTCNGTTALNQMPQASTLQCLLFNEKGLFLKSFTSCQIPKNTLSNSSSYYLAFTFNYQSWQNISGIFKVETAAVVPYCSINSNQNLLVSIKNDTLLRAQLFHGNADNYVFVWGFTQYWTDINGTETTMNYDELISQNQLNNSLNLLIKAGDMKRNQVYSASLTVVDKVTMTAATSCEVSIQTVDIQAQIIPLMINSPQIQKDSYINPNVTQKFMCQAQGQFNGSSFLWNLYQVSQNMPALHIPLNNSQVVSQASNYLVMSHMFLNQSSFYSLSCTLKGAQLYGYTALTFTTLNLNQQVLALNVTPPSGIAYQTQFAFQIIQQQDYSSFYQCDFGYIDQSSGNYVTLYSASQYVNQNMTSTSLLLPGSNQSLQVFADCQDSEGNMINLIQMVNVSIGTFSPSINSTLQALINPNNLTNQDPSQVFTVVSSQLQQYSASMDQTTLTSSYLAVMSSIQSIGVEAMSTSQTYQAATFLLDLTYAIQTNSNISSNNDMIGQCSRILTSILTGSSSSSNSTNSTNSTNNSGPPPSNRLLQSMTPQSQQQQQGQMKMMENLNLELMNYGTLMNYTALDIDTVQVLLEAADNLLPYLMNLSQDSAIQVLQSLNEGIDRGIANLAPESAALDMSGSNFALKIRKVTSDEIAASSTLAFSVSSLNSTQSNTNFSLDLSDPLFSQDSTIIFKAAIANRKVKSNTTNATTTIAGQNGTQLQQMQLLVSDIIIVSAQSASSVISFDGTYQMEDIQVRGLAKPFYFQIATQQPPAMQGSSGGGSSSNGFLSGNKSCAYFDSNAQMWIAMNTASCAQSTSNNSMTCCSTHMTEFAIIETVMVMLSATDDENATYSMHDPISVAGDIAFVEATLITFDSLLVILVIVGLVLDHKNLLMLYQRDIKINQQQFTSIADAKPQQAPPPVKAVFQNEDEASQRNQNKNKKTRNTQQVDQEEGEDIQNEGGSDEDASPSGNDTNNQQVSQEKVYEGLLPPIHTIKSLKDEKKKKKTDKHVHKKKSTENQASSADGSGSENSNALENDAHAQTKGELDESVHPDKYNNHLQVLEDSEALDRSEDQFMSSAKVLNMNEMNNNQDEGGLQGIAQKSNQKEVVAAAQQSKGLMTRASTKSLKPLFFKDIFYMTMKTYNKVTGIFYAETPYLPRSLKVIGSIANIIIMLCLTGVFTVYVSISQTPLIEVQVQIDGYSGSIVIPLLILKVIDIMFYCMSSRSMLKSKALCRNIVVGCLQFAILVGMNIWAISIGGNADESQMTTWQNSFIAVLFIQLLPIEFIGLPMMIRLYIKYRKGGRNDLSPPFRQQL